MAFVECPGVAEVQIRFTASSIFVGECSMYFLDSQSDTPDASRLQDLVGQIEGGIVGVSNIYYSTGVKVDRFDARALWTQFGPVFSLAGDALTVGASSGALLPANVTLACSFRTGLAGRSFRGRNFVVGLTEAMVTGDYLISPFDARILEFYTEIADSVLAADWTHVVLSRETAGAPRAEGVATPVTAYQLTDLRVDTMKSRLNH